MRHRVILPILLVVALVPLGAITAGAQCVPFTHVGEGHFQLPDGWVQDAAAITIDGEAVEFTAQPLPIPDYFGPVDHGWSTHGTEAVMPSLAGHRESSFKQWTEFVATVDMKKTGFSGDRRELMKLTAPYTVYFDYKGQAKVFEGSGAFAGVKGNLVVRGPFWLTFVNLIIDGKPLLLPVDGWYAFETQGMLCGAAGWR